MISLLLRGKKNKIEKKLIFNKYLFKYSINISFYSKI
jgi:hypothetical protein